MTQDHRLSELQLAIMRVLWDTQEASVTDVHAALQADRGLAPTTIATVLSRLEKRALVTHRAEGRQFIYRPLITEEQVRNSMVVDLTDLLFKGDPTELVNHLIQGRDFSADDLARMKERIQDLENHEGIHDDSD